jgi:ABC-2 type transport system permease protein
LQRGALAGWTATLFLMGFLYGSIAQDIEQMLEDNQVMADMFDRLGGAGLTDSFFAAGMGQLGLMGGAFAISSALRLATEEAVGRAEPILAGSTSRWRWGASHLVIAALGTIVTMSAAGLGIGISYAAITNDAEQIPRLLGSALVTVPAILVLLGVAVAVFGTFPSAARAAWAALAVAVGVGFFGELIQLPQWTRQISPFEHVPALPAEDLTLLPLVVLALIAAASVAIGLASFRARDLRTE